MTKGRGLIALNHEVACPGEPVRNHRPEQRIPGMADHNSDNHGAQTQRGSCRVHPAVAGIAVFMQIEQKEFFVAGKLLFGHFFSSAAIVRTKSSFEFGDARILHATLWPGNTAPWRADAAASPSFHRPSPQKPAAPGTGGQEF